MEEIVVVPESSARGKNKPSSSSSKKPIQRSRTVGFVPEPFDSEKLPPTLISDIRRFLRVANQIELEWPRVAYLCRFHAFERAHVMDPSSSGRGVRQFKTSLLQRLEQDEEDTILKRKEKSDLRELTRAYQKYEDYIRKHSEDSNKGAQLMNARGIAFVLSEVLKTVTSGTGLEIVSDTEDGNAKSEFYGAYNILPLDPGGEHQAIMQLPEVKAAVIAVRNIRGLPSAENFQRPGPFSDLLDWLQCWFGFQKGNVSNQREHLILLLANIHIRQGHEAASMSKLGERAVNDLMKRLFRNYKRWCRFLGRKSNIRLPSLKLEEQQYKLLYIGLYLLIWGEASNLRFMPECLCYLFHHMAYELHGVLSGAIGQATGELVRPEYGGEPESFLSKVITPIYMVIYKEAEKNKSGTADHSEWRNYDDLNEYFWSPDCFQLGWPLRLDHDFFFVQSSVDHHVKNAKESKKKKVPVVDPQSLMEQSEIATTPPVREISPLIWKEKVEDSSQVIEDKDREPKWLGKKNFVENRSFWQLFRSFDRMWIFFILALQVMIIMAWHELGSLFHLFDKVVFEDIMSIFITSAVLKLIQALLDLSFTWKVRHTMDSYQFVRYALKPVSAAIWTIVLPVFYADSRRNSRCSVKQSGSWVGDWCLSSYMVTVAFYMASNAIGMVLFLVPVVNKYVETSSWRVCTLFSWWAQPRLYVGRGMQENLLSLMKYTLFWILLLLSKFSFSYHFEIKPLIQPTKKIMKIGVSAYDWHELFPKVKSNAGAIVAIWAPILLVYFMDTQIWYSVFCAVFGGIYGVFRHLGEIRTMGMLRSKFQSLAFAFNVSLVPPSSKHDQGRNIRGFLKQKLHKTSDNEKKVVAKFAQVWNQIITSFRSEDLINNREMDLMTIPMSLELGSGLIRWPVFLLATKFSTALNTTKHFVGKDEKLLKKIRKDNFMYLAVKECYESLKYILLDVLVVGELEKRILSEIIGEVETSIHESTLLINFRMSQLPDLHSKCIELVTLLVENKEHEQEKVVKILQDIFEVVMQDMMTHGSRLLDLLYCRPPSLEEDTCFFKVVQPQLFASFNGNSTILFPLPDSAPLKEQITRLLLLLTVKETAMEIPVNLDARRRISFFATSLFMDMPCAPKVRNMLSFSVLTPHFKEEINYSTKELHWSQEGGVSIMFYMQKMYPDEWKNFLERMQCENLEDINIKQKDEDLRKWASFRGQTLSRTVRGMMYYREAIKLQAFLDMAEDEDIFEDYNYIEKRYDRKNGPHSLSAQLDAVADMKFTYVIACQMFGVQKSSGDSHAQDIIALMMRYPSLRVAYVEEKEVIGMQKPQKMYSSILVKAVNNLDQEIYRIKLPGPPNIGEGKPENQNHAIIFTRGDALQAIDMNQDNYIEEAFKMRNVLQEFLRHQERQPPTIIGLREHIFTGSVSSLAWFMSYQETSFVTIGQRLLANPLRVRFHYGHPDLFDRVFHLTRGGISKASRTINLSEDVFAGFNSILRQGCVRYHEYMQVGKGRDVGLNQISQFEAKVANGNSEQTLSRDIYRLGRRFDFFRMLSCYFTTVGFYFSCLLSVLGIYVFLYGQLYLVLSGLEKAILLEARMQNIESLETALASQSYIQLGLLTGLPMVMEIGLEKGFLAALKDFVLMQLQLAAVFFTFSLGTKSHYYGRTILHGGAKYRPTGRKVVVFHASFTENYRLYSRSHFVKGFELMLLLIVYNLFRRSYQSSMTYVLITYSIWFMSATWLFAPFLFNPAGFDWGKIVDDWTDWNKWIKNQGGIGVQQDKSWESWWNDEQAHLRRCGISARIIEILLSLRFFIYQYGMVYHLDISKDNKNFLVYVLSWLVLLLIFILTKAMNVGRLLLASNYQLSFRILKAFLFLGALSIIISLSIVCDLSLMDLIVGSLAFMPTGWGLILIAQAVRPKIEDSGLWDFVQVLAQAYDYSMGIALFAPIAALAWLPIISAFQTRFLFNEAFNRRLQILTILAGKKKHK